MKMGFLFSGFFWGVVLVLIGVLMVLNAVFGIRVPIFKIVVALVFITIGVQMLTGVSIWRRERNQAVFEEKALVVAETDREYSVVFGKGSVDLTGVAVADKVVKKEINTVFGSSRVYLDPAVPAKIVVSSAFGEARLPNGNSVNFGDQTFKTDSLKDGAPHLLVEATVVFGQMDFVFKSKPAPDSAKPTPEKTP